MLPLISGNIITNFGLKIFNNDFDASHCLYIMWTSIYKVLNSSRQNVVVYLFAINQIIIVLVVDWTIWPAESPIYFCSILSSVVGRAVSGHVTMTSSGQFTDLPMTQWLRHLLALVIVCPTSTSGFTCFCY